MDEEEVEISSIDFDHLPDILHKWLEHERLDQQSFLTGTHDYVNELDDVLIIPEAIFLILYLAAEFEINVKMSFENGSVIAMTDGEPETWMEEGDDECE